MILHPFGYGVAFATIYLFLLDRGGLVPGGRDGFLYGLGVFLVGSLPVYLLAFASFRVTPDVIVSWIAQSACQYLAAGFAIGLAARPGRVGIGPSMVVRAATDLEIPAETGWELLKRRDTFLFITRGAMRYRGADTWPEILMAPGVEIETIVHPLWVLPGSPHTFRIVRVDEGSMAVDTEESGGFIQAWNHSMKVRPVSGSRCRYEDRIELRAGPVTPIVWLFASLFYRYRQSRWRRLASSPEAGT